MLSTGPVAMTSLLTAASVTALRPHGLDQFYAYVTLLALLSGLFQLGFGLARAGMLISLVSHPVLMGFINAAALVIALSQLPALQPESMDTPFSSANSSKVIPGFATHLQALPDLPKVT